MSGLWPPFCPLKWMNLKLIINPELSVGLTDVIRPTEGYHRYSSPKILARTTTYPKADSSPLSGPSGLSARDPITACCRAIAVALLSRGRCHVFLYHRTEGSVSWSQPLCHADTCCPRLGRFVLGAPMVCWRLGQWWVTIIGACQPHQFHPHVNDDYG